MIRRHSQNGKQTSTRDLISYLVSGNMLVQGALLLLVFKHNVMVEMYHRTRDDRTMLICEMDDNHLSNTISMFITNIGKAKTLLEMTKNGGRDDFESALFGDYKSLSKHELKKIIKDNSDRLQYYLGEAMLRGMDFSKQLQELYGRSTSVSFNLGHALPSPGEFDDFDEVDED